MGFWATVRADLDRHHASSVRALALEPQARWLIKLRIAEHLGSRSAVLRLVGRWWTANSGARLGFSIPLNVLGPGIKLTHVGTVAINRAATVGSHCVIVTDVVLEASDTGVPRIGDNVYIGPGVKVIGGVHVGDGAVLAAGAVVLHDVPAGQTVVGNPARPVTAGA